MLCTIYTAVDFGSTVAYTVMSRELKNNAEMMVSKFTTPKPFTISNQSKTMGKQTLRPLPHFKRASKTCMEGINGDIQTSSVFYCQRPAYFLNIIFCI